MTIAFVIISVVVVGLIHLVITQWPVFQKQDTAHLSTKAANEEEGLDAGPKERAQTEEAHTESQIEQTEGKRKRNVVSRMNQRRQYTLTQDWKWNKESLGKAIEMKE